MGEHGLEAELRLLAEGFVAGLPEQLGGIETAWVRIRRNGWDLAAAESLLQKAHKLAGEAGSLGFGEIARSAGQLQDILQGIPDKENSERTGQLYERLEKSIQSLRTAVYTDRQTDLTGLRLARGISASLQEKRSNRLIYMVEDDPIQAAELAAQVGYFGYTVQIFYNLAGLANAIRQVMPTALLMDISFPEGKMAGFKALESLRKELADIPPVIFISINDSMQYRLEAVRVGGEAYFTKPVDVDALIDVLDRLVFQETAVPYRILIVDDSRVQANYNAIQLKKAGMVTEIVSDPLQVIDHLISFKPDLLLLDMYMPDYTGTELAKVIRQMEQFISVPIVFLSGETDKGKQLAALGLGGDDFLTKPIESVYLIAAITTRVDRYRKLRALMVQDSLTGLFNHSTIKDRLAQEVERAKRQSLHLAYAMIDLDNFKSVNDTYGHATGDRVLKSLANMLRQRLRSSDIIGRYGGEEFAVILPNTDEQTAVKILAELCEGFSKIRHHHSGDKEFQVTFSCGVAAFPDCDNADALNKTSDLALYAAKTAGRNRVIRASECNGDEIKAARAYPALVRSSAGLSHAVIYQNLVKRANSMIVRINTRGVITFANEYAQRFFGYPEEELVGQTMLETLAPVCGASDTGLKAMIAGIASHPDRFAQVERENIRKSGEKVWIAWSNVPLLDEDGNLMEILCIGNDITTRKNAEANLTRSVARLAALNRIAQAVVGQEDLASIVKVATREVADLFKARNVGVALLNADRTGLELIDDFLGNREESGDPGEIFNLGDRPASVQAFETGRAILVNNALTNPHAQVAPGSPGGNRVISRIVVPLLVRGKAIGTMNIDFEDPHQQVDPAELELAETIGGILAGVIENNRLFSVEQRQRQYFEALLSNLPSAVVMIDPRAKILSWNPAAERLFGYLAGEVLGEDIDELLTSEEYRQEAKSYTQGTSQQGELIHSFTRRRRKDGSLADVELLAVAVRVNGEQIGSMAIYHDISELQRARQEAETANQAKSAFLATMSHEIRTPLNAIVGMTTLLKDTPLTAEQSEFSETIRNSSDALLTIISDILDFSKIEAGRMELEEQPFDLRECLESALDLVAGKATEKGIDLAYLVDPNVPPVIISDSTRLRQILLNLLSNSLKFTEEGEVVLSVSAEKTGEPAKKANRLHFTVRDTGIGIPSGQMDRLFRSFSQVDASTTRKYGGTGLGLAISKRLAELLDGEMWVESEGVPGKGSTFHFTILADQSSSPLPVFMNRKQPELSGKRVLIVDDNATNRYILMRQVQSWGMVSQETALPRQALQWVEEGKPFDVALLDMQMPEMDGVTLAAEIQRCCQNKTNLPIVMLTSLGLREADQDRVTFAAYLTKPIKPAVLYATLLEVFGARPVALKHVKSEFEAPSQALKPLRILLAEDNMVNKKVALRLLERLGYKVDVAGNGLEVLEALQRQPYDVILMDVQMPEMDGLETTRQVRNGRWVETGKDATFVYQPYIIAMTASAMQGDREGCLAAGMDDYISKPIHLDELARVLGEARPSRLEEETSPSAPVAPPAPEKGNPVIDEETFRKFHQMVGDEDAGMMISLIKDYLDESPQLLAELHQAEVQKDREKTRRIAHSLGSSSMLFGALRLADLCRSVELGTRNGNLQHVPELILQVESEFKEVQIALETKYHRVQEK